MIKLKTQQKIFLIVLISLFLSPYIFGAQLDASVAAFSDVIWVEEDYSTALEAADVANSGSIEVDQTADMSFQENSTGTFQGGHQMLQVSSFSNSASFSRHIMCKDVDIDIDGSVVVNPIDATTIFRPSDTKAVCLATVSINDTMEFRWYHRSNSSKTWVSCYNFSKSLGPGERHYWGWLNIVGYWPGYHYPRAYKVEVYLDGSPSPSFSEFFEVTNGGLNSARVCKDVDVDGNPINMKSRFTIDNDTEVYHSLRFDKIAYFNEELGCCHNFTTVWIQPNGSMYKTYSSNFTDYKNTNVTWNYWEYNYPLDDYILIDPSTPVGNWKVEVYLDRYFNSTWMRYGPIATTPFIVGSEPVADWTFMVYLDADIDIEWAGIDIFEKMASVGSSSQVNIVVQMDRISSEKLWDDTRYGDWTDCKRFNVTKGMTPTPENAALNLSEVNMGHPDTLKDFINWTIHHYPANYYSLVLWDHGAGCMGVCVDYTNAGDELSLPDLSQALSGLPAIMDVVFLDACSMSMTEVAYQIKDYANVLVGPEGLGWGPPPYDEYLLNLATNSSMLPSAFARELVTDYINWCMPNDIIQNATMSATDLTKIRSLMAAIDDFALKLKEKETPYLSLVFASHDQIIKARNLTEGYIGPYTGNTSCYIDLYNFTQLTYQYVVDEEFRNTADQVMTTLEDIIIMEVNKARPDSHGLSIFFPDEKWKYDSFEGMYEETTFAEDTPWDEFVEYHLSGYVLTIETPYPDTLVKVDEESYRTDADGKIRVFVLPDSYTVNVTTPVETGSGSRGVFAQWNDNDTSNPRTLNVDKTLTLEAEYETQYYVTIGQSGVGIDFTGTVVTVDGTEYNATNLPVSFWWDDGSSYDFAFRSPLVVTTDCKRYVWISTSGLSSLQGNSITVSISDTIIGNYKTQYYLTIASSYGSPTLMSDWFEAGESITANVTSPWSAGAADTRYVCTGWTGAGSLSTSGTTTSVTFTIDEASSITWNWKTQYLLTVGTDPTGISPLPTRDPAGEAGPGGWWYDNGTPVSCTAQKISGRVFDHWTVDEARWDPGVDTITITMDGPYEATAQYERELPWWEILFSLEWLNFIIAFVGVALPVALLGVAWVRTRRKRGIIKDLLNKIDEVYSRFKMNRLKCEEELHKLRNAILEDLTDGKITQENYDIMDKKIEGYLEELRKK